MNLPICANLLIFILIFSCFVNVYATPTPPPNQSRIDVRVGLFINDIGSINEKTETINIELTQFVQWQDKRLGFQPESHGSNVIYFNNNASLDKLKTIWYPNLILRHTRGAAKIISRSLSITSSGIVTYIKRFSVAMETTIDMHKFPFDKQKIEISLIPFGQDFGNIKFFIDKKHEGVALKAHEKEWHVYGFSAKTSMLQSYNGQMLPEYTLLINYERKSTYYLLKMMLPLFLVVVLSSFVFWLKEIPTINTLNYVLVTLLTIVAFQWVIYDSTPKVPYTTLYQMLILLSYFIVGISLISLLIINNAKKQKARLYMQCSRYLFPSLFILGVIALHIIFLYQ